MAPSYLTGVCPICGQLIKDDEKFGIEYIRDRQHWMFVHLRRQQPTDSEHSTHLTDRHGVKYVTYCAQAGFNPMTGDFATRFPAPKDK